MALLWVEIFEVYLGVKSGSRLAVEWVMVPGIGYTFKCFLDTLGVIEELKNPCGGRGYVDDRLKPSFHIFLSSSCVPATATVCSRRLASISTSTVPVPAH